MQQIEEQYGLRWSREPTHWSQAMSGAAASDRRGDEPLGRPGAARQALILHRVSTLG